MNPLKLETMALREVITKKGLCSDYTDLMVPRMRQELEQLSRLPGDYEVVAEEIKVTRMDGRAADNDDWLRRTRGGERVSITCGPGPVWRVVMEGLGESDICLGSETWKCPDSGVAHFRHGFVEDGVLKRQLWKEQEAGMKAASLCCGSEAHSVLVSAVMLRLDMPERAGMPGLAWPGVEVMLL